MKALHLASFNGNIGDIANHIGFWNLFKKYVDNTVNVTPLEMREFYQSWNLRKFDSESVSEVNRYDLLVIGGGNFFDVKWDYSDTGTTLNLSPALLDKITIPIVFNGMGAEYSPAPRFEQARRSFDSFIHSIDGREKTVVSVRNDDSMMLLKTFFSTPALQNIIQIPDGGFFTSAKEYCHPEIPAGQKIIAVNLAKDRIADRWGNEKNYLAYCQEFAQFIKKVLSDNQAYHFVFVPHIPSDLQAILDVLQYVDDCYCRRSVTIAPYLNGWNTPGDYLVDLYRKASVSIGMRYHSNICSIAMETPTIGIVTLDKHVALYKSIGMQDRLFNVRTTPFKEALYERLSSVIANRETLVQQNRQLVSRLEQDSLDYYRKIKELL